MKQITKLLIVTMLCLGLAGGSVSLLSNTRVYADIGTGCNDDDDDTECGDDSEITNLRKKRVCQDAGGFWSFQLETDENGVSGPDSDVAQYECWLKVTDKNRRSCSGTGGRWRTGQAAPLQVIRVTGANPAVCVMEPLDENDKNLDRNDGDDDISGIGGQYREDDCKADAEDLNSDNCGVLRAIIIITNVLSGLAATVIVAMIVWGGIQYSMAGADAAKVQAAKQKIMNALIALLLLIFGFSIIQWLVPGGLI